MLTSIPARLLHAAHAAATALVVLTELGLELLCHEHDHRAGLARLENAA